MQCPCHCSVHIIAVSMLLRRPCHCSVHVVSVSMSLQRPCSCSFHHIAMPMSLQHPCHCSIHIAASMSLQHPCHCSIHVTAAPMSLLVHSGWVPHELFTSLPWLRPKILSGEFSVHWSSPANTVYVSTCLLRSDVLGQEAYILQVTVNTFSRLHSTKKFENERTKKRNMILGIIFMSDCSVLWWSTIMTLIYATTWLFSLVVHSDILLQIFQGLANG